MRIQLENRRGLPRLFAFGLPLVLSMVLLGGCSPEEPDRYPRPDFTAPEVPGSELVVAEIDGEPVTAGQLWHKLRIQFPEWEHEGPGMARQIREILPQLISERCFANWGDDLGLADAPPVQRAWFFSREFILKNHTMDKKVYARAKPSEEEVRAHYEENKERFELPPRVWYHHILVESEAEAWDLRQRILAGDEFETLAAEFSLDTLSAQRGGKMPPMNARYECGPLGKLPDLGRVVMEMEEKELSKPIRSRLGWHLVRADYRRDRIPRAFDEVREEIENKLATRRQSDLFQQVLDSLQVAFGVRIYEDTLDEFYFLQMDDEELFSGAQRQRDPEYKIKMYQEILDRFPDSPRRPEALFMIGFVHAEERADSTQALAVFRAFLEEYPDHEMARSARLMVDELE